ncbi:MAG: hypothetical protein OER92_01880 [Alphaproteobacteria bacterium]|nr:hypothetical protein [Alphaproteobacteria bacterium]
MNFVIGLIIFAAGVAVVFWARPLAKISQRHNEDFWSFKYPDKLGYLSTVIVGLLFIIIGLNFVVVDLFFPQYPGGLLTLLPRFDSPSENNSASPALLAFISIGFIVAGTTLILNLNRKAKAPRSHPGIFGSKIYLAFNKWMGVAFAFVFLAVGLLMLLVVISVI